MTYEYIGYPFFTVCYVFGLYNLNISPSVQEEQRLRLRLSTLEQDLVDKERQLQDAVSRQRELMERVNLLRNKEMDVKEENERLLKAKVTANHINGISTCPEPNFVTFYNRWKWRKFDFEINSWQIGKGILQNIMHQIPFDILCIYVIVAYVICWKIMAVYKVGCAVVRYG